MRPGQPLRAGLVPAYDKGATPIGVTPLLVSEEVSGQRPATCLASADLRFAAWFS
jgi:hypothetical protein